MMKLKFLFDNRPLVEMVLKYWNYDPGSLDLLNQYRISSNAIYPFAFKEKVQLLRFAPVSEKDHQNLLAELEFINFLNDQHYPALKIVRSKKDQELVRADTPWGVFFAVVFERVAGEPLTKTELSQEILTEYGKSLGRLHKLSSQYKPEIERWSHKQVLAWIKRTLSSYPDQEPALKELEDVRNTLSRLPQTTENYGLVHYDFELDNVFYDPEARQCSVIDFDDAMYHWYGMDIQQMLGSLQDELEPERYGQAAAWVLDGYRAEYPLPEETMRLMPLFGRFANLYGYTRILRASAEIWENEPEWLEHLRHVLDKALAGKRAAFKP